MFIDIFADDNSPSSSVRLKVALMTSYILGEVLFIAPLMTGGVVVSNTCNAALEVPAIVMKDEFTVIVCAPIVNSLGTVKLYLNTP